MATMTEIAYTASIIPSNVSIMLSGCHGCGKTEWVENYLGKKVWGLERVVTWHPAHASDTGDVTGLPDKQPNINGEIVTKFCPPDWMAQKEPVLLLIDEANRGLSLVQNAIMQLTCSGTYGGVTLPKGSRIVACINPDDSGEYDVGTMDLAQKDRFCWFSFEPTVKETLDYFVEKGLNSRVIDFINDHPDYLDFNHFTNKELLEAAKNTGIGRTPSCRSWERVAHTVTNAEKDGALTDDFKRKCLLIAIQGMVGTTCATLFQDYLKPGRVLNAETVLLADKFLDEWVKYFKEIDVPSAKTFVSGVSLWLNGHNDLIKDKATCTTIAKNFGEMIKALRRDIQRTVLTDEIMPAAHKGATWVSALIAANAEIRDIYVKAAKLV